MESYGEFAKVYDMFMEDTPYDAWISYIEAIWNREMSYKPVDILELGCGTGSITVRLAQKGYDTIGLDLSEDMLTVAKEKAQNIGKDILFINQDMRTFELYGTVDCVVCLCDGVNYLLSESDILSMFKLVNNYLNPEGLFIFDMNTGHKYGTIMADNTFAHSFDDGAYIWENDFNEQTGINEYALDFFVKTSQGLYERFEETHIQRAYPVETVCRLLEQAGLDVLHVYDECTFENAHAESERVHFITRKGGENNHE